ncbi:hypothetical protein [Dactylosporangium sp. NPDC051484]|uniref:hypothetical protein n=1 Tax=Dactylosporangium sp. NPDC051484 TaxID=3154942 RepID=UPI00344E2B63
MRTPYRDRCEDFGHAVYRSEYLPVVRTAVGPGTLRAYSSYWNRIEQQWGDRRMDDVKPTDIGGLVEQVKANPGRELSAALCGGAVDLEAYLRDVGLCLILEGRDG